MKKIIGFFLCLIFSTSAMAGQDDKLLESILTEMAKQYAMDYGKTVLTKTIQEKVLETWSVNIGGTVSYGLAAYGLYESAKSYDEAKSESSRYQALSQGLVTIIAMCNPIAGLVAQFAGMAEGLNAALVSKRYALILKQKLLEIANLENKTSELIKKEYFNEQLAIEFYLAKIQVTALLIEKNAAFLKNNCALAELSSDEHITSFCIKKTFLQLGLFNSLARNSGKIMTFPSRFGIVNLLSDPETLSILEESIKTSTQAITRLNSEVGVFTQRQAEGMLIGSKEEAVQKVMKFRCERVITNELRSCLEAKRTLLLNASDIYARSDIESARENLAEITETICKRSLSSLAPTLINLLKSQTCQ